MTGKTISLLLFTFVLLVPAARADLTFCNKTKETIWSTIAFYNDSCDAGHYDTKGWYVLVPCECRTVWRGNALNKQFYYYAQDEGACHTWKGTRQFKVSQDRNFTEHKSNYVTANCNTRDFLDFVSTSSDHTLNFTEN